MALRIILCLTAAPASRALYGPIRPRAGRSVVAARATRDKELSRVLGGVASWLSRGAGAAYPSALQGDM